MTTCMSKSDRNSNMSDDAQVLFFCTCMDSVLPSRRNFTANCPRLNFFVYILGKTQGGKKLRFPPIFEKLR